MFATLEKLGYQLKSMDDEAVLYEDELGINILIMKKLRRVSKIGNGMHLSLTIDEIKAISRMGFK